MKTKELVLVSINNVPYYKLTMHQFMSAIWDKFGRVTIHWLSGSVTIFKDDPHPNQSYWIQFSEDDIFAIIPFDGDVFVNYEGELLILNKYILDENNTKNFKDGVTLTFYQKAPKLDTLQFL